MKYLDALDSPIWLIKLAEHVESLGFDVSRCLMECQLPPLAEIRGMNRVSFFKISAFFERCASEVGDDLLGFRFGSIIDPRDAGIVGFLGFYSKNLAYGIENSVRYATILGDAEVIDISSLSDDGTLTFHFRGTEGLGHIQYAEWFSAACIHASRLATRREIKFRLVHFSHNRRSRVDKMKNYFGVRPVFGSPENAIQFYLEDLQVDIAWHDSKLAGLLISIADDFLRERLSTERDILTRLETEIFRRLPGGDLRRLAVSTALGMSQRTLARKLKKQGLTYQDVIADVRSALATRYLTQSSAGQAQIAYMLGLSGQAAFSNAFRRWTGRTPGSVRRSSGALTSDFHQADSFTTG